MLKYLFNLMIVFAPAYVSAQTLLFTDFSNGIPDDYTCIDNDGLQPAASMQAKGFEVGKAWIDIVVDNGNDKAACSTSYYTPKGVADDWLITPLLHVSDDNVELRWRAKANNSKYRDGYKVMLSEGGNEVADFGTSLYAVDAEDNSWQDHTISLAEYAGKDIRIAFVNNSDNKECLLIDDIYVGISNPVICTLDIPPVTPIGGVFPLTATIVNHSDAAIDDVELTINFDDKDIVCHTATAVGAGESAKCALTESVNLPVHRRVAYTVAAKVGQKTFEYTGSVISYPRKVVAEEGTATWCGWCIRGVVMMDRMEEKYPDRFISMTVHKNDVMTVDGYIDNLNSINDNILLVNIPNAVVNRRIMCDPTYIDVNYRSSFGDEPVMVAMKADALCNEADNNINVTTNLYFAEPQSEADYRLAYYVVEDEVYHPGNEDYVQANAYSGAGEDWDGYENKGSEISDMRYRNVVRGYNELFDGVEGSIPPTFDADEEIAHSYVMPVPDNVDNIKKCHMVVMLIDMTDRHIVNACTAPLSSPAAVETIAYGNDSSDNDSDYEVFMPDGRVVAKGASLNNILAGRAGLYVIKKGNSIYKTIVRP